MFKSKLSIAAVFILISVMAFTMVGCGPDDPVDPDDPVEEVKGEVEILYVEWECATASTYVARQYWKTWVMK